MAENYENYKFLPFKEEGPLYTLIITPDNYHLMEWHLTLEDETHSDVEMGPARPIHPMRLNMFQGGMGHAGPIPPYNYPIIPALWPSLLKTGSIFTRVMLMCVF
jgi:hypothetical protein